MSAIVLADDLTGAADCQGALWPRYTSVAYLPETAEVERAGVQPSDVVVVDTEARVKDENASVDVSLGWMRRLLAGAEAEPLVYLKIDSGLRGPIGALVHAAAGELGATCVPVVPANPREGRTTIDGCQRVHEQLVHESAYALDPVHPIRTSRIADLFQGRAGLDIAEVTLASVHEGPSALSRLLVERSDVPRVLVIDAVTEADLGIVAEAIARTATPLVCGSAGLVRHLRLPKTQTRKQAESESHAWHRRRATLVVAGSIHPTTTEQLLELGLVHGLAPTVFAEEPNPNHVARTLANMLESNGHAVLASPRQPRGPEDDPTAEGDRIGRVLGDIVRETNERVEIDALLVVGGRTAYHVCRALEIPGFRIAGRLPGDVPWFRAVGNDRLLLFKPGGFGHCETLVDWVSLLKGGGIGSVPGGPAASPTERDSRSEATRRLAR